MALALALGAAAGVQAGGKPQAADRSAAQPVTDRIIVKYKDTAIAPATTANPRLAGPSAAQARVMADAANEVGLRISHLRRNALQAHVMKLERFATKPELDRVLARIKADPNVEYAEPDRIMQVMFTPNDTRYGEQWHYFEATAGINLPAAWDKATGAGINVAVIDTGYRPHADLAANIVGGYDMINDTAVSVDGNGRDADATDPGDWYAANACGSGVPGSDSSWHGTHVAGTIAAVTNNGVGVAGVAFNSKVVPIRALGRCGGYTSDIADGMIWASGGTVAGLPANPNPARVLNLSLGGSGACDTTSQNAINSARSRNAVVVVAAGNSNVNASNASPANCAGVITVAAVGRNGGKANYSNFGTVVSVAAPGGNMSSGTANGVLSTLNAGAQGPGADNYEFYQGTSMATPHVAGVVALMLSKNASLTPDQVKTMLQNTARPFPATCSQCGSGIIDANAAVDAAMGTGGGGGGGGTGVTISETTASNNTRGTAQSITNRNTTVNGSISSTTDTDYYALSLPAGATLAATLTPPSNADYDLQIQNSAGTVIARSELGTGQVDSASVRNSGTTATTVYVRVVYYSGATGTTSGRYTLRMAW
ncbi:MAG TPA: S8 family peptidase [Burkholderiaceae bacterium]|nr:S8 family peptidase [Burkholderiaceae bacterium]